MGSIATLALLFSGYVLYPTKLYTLEKTYDVGIFCKDNTKEECIIFENAVKNISNINVVNQDPNKKISENTDFWFIFYRGHSNSYDGLISISPNINDTNHQLSAISYSFFDETPYVDVDVAKIIVDSLIEQIKKGN